MYSIGNQEGIGLSIRKNKMLPRSPRRAAQAVTCTIESFQQSLPAETEHEEIMPDEHITGEVVPAPDGENTLLDTERSICHKK